jgi:isopenicillin N synthase-like dioxygenase
MTETLAKINVASLLQTGTDAATRTAQQQCSAQLLEALTTTGFAILQNTNVPPAVLADMRSAVKTVFDAPRALYAESRVQKTNYRGYVPLGYFTPNAGSTQADQYEAWKLHSETGNTAPNIWPPLADEAAAQVCSAVLAYWAEMDCLNFAVMDALCDALGLNRKQVLETLDKPLTNMTLLNYPPADAHAMDAWGIHPHKDFNYLTFLAHDPVGGLEVRTRDGIWIDAACAEGEYVLNVGDMLELLSGGRLVSTPHRVVNRSGEQRQSFPYFSVPRADVVVEPLLERLPGFTRQPLQSGAASHDIWSSNWPDSAVKDKGIDLGDYARNESVPAHGTK